MANLYFLGKPVNNEFRPPGRVGPSSSETTLVRQTLPKRAGERDRLTQVYASQIRRRPGTWEHTHEAKHILDDEEHKETPSSRTSDSRKTHPRSSIKSEAFDLPPEFDFSVATEIRRNSVFHSPHDIKVKDNTKDGADSSFTQPPDFDFAALSTISSPVKKCPFCQKQLPKGFIESPPRAARAKFGYCQRHENEATFQDGRKKGYPKPNTFDFRVIDQRIRKLLPEIQKSLEKRSEFVDTIRSKTTARKAATPMSTYNFVQNMQPGYYGPRGAQLITGIAMKELGAEIRRRESIREDVEFFGGIMGFVSAVVVPEVGVRLIMKDMNLKRKEARKVMSESVQYGAVVNPAEEEDCSTDDDG